MAEAATTRSITMKSIHLSRVTDAAFVEELRNEVAVLKALDHPHIVSVYSVGEERGVHYYAMRLVCGESMIRRLAAWSRCFRPLLTAYSEILSNLCGRTDFLIILSGM